MRRVLRHPSAAAGLTVLSIIVLVSVIGLFWTPYDPYQMAPRERFLPPSLEHLMGTDQYGRDILSRVMVGGHLTLMTGFLSVAIAVAVGVTLGLLGAYLGGRVDLAVVAAMDVLLAFPAVLLALGVVAVLGSSTTNVIIAVGIATIPVFNRVTRASVLSVTARPFVRSAVAMGCTDRHIVVRHILPNIAGPLIVLTAITVAGAILVGSALSFLGLGAPPPTPEWGVMLNDARAYMQLGWWLTVMPGLAIAATVLALNVLGDGLRDVLDPTSRATDGLG
jgi:peptide/nickel transport system permease protein